MVEYVPPEAESSRPEVRMLVRELVTAYVEKEAPDQIADLQKLFPALYRATSAAAKGGASSHPELGHGSNQLLVLVVAVAYSFVTTVLQAQSCGKNGPPTVALDRTERYLEDRTEDPQLVGALRALLDAHLDRLSKIALPAAAKELEPEAADVRPSDDGPGVQSFPREEPKLQVPAPDVFQRWTDLFILVEEERRDGRSFLRYRVGSPDPARGLNFRSFETAMFKDDPRDFFRRSYSAVERIGEQRLDAESKMNRFTGHARRLTGELLPPGMANVLRSQVGRSHSLLILSEEPWIPWELLCLGDDEHGHPIFLGEHFAITRWRTGEERRWSMEFPLRSIAVVAPSGTGLDWARRASSLIQTMVDSESEVTEIPGRYGSVVESLRTGVYDLWHFAGHGAAPSRRWNDWRLELEDGVDLQPADLAGVGLQAHPLVFLNACAVGRSEFSLTSIAGLCESFIEEGAGAVIGPLWAVRDESAFRFANALYSGLLGGYTLGEAARRARAAGGSRDRHDPTRLAYAVFGHPNAVSKRRGEK